MHEFLSAWKRFTPEAPPYVLHGDEPLLSDRSVSRQSGGWAEYIADPDVGAPGIAPLHLGLLPTPFVGDLTGASVFLLMLNPGFGPHDYFGEYQVPEYREAMLNNLSQAPGASFLFLDPRFSWHGGYSYWHSKLRSLIHEFARRTGISYGQSRDHFRREIAAVELTPYHSASFTLPTRVLEGLASARLARTFARDVLLPRANAGDCLVVVTRAVRTWRLPSAANVICYKSTEARSAHVGPGSTGGKAILDFLIAKFSHGSERTSR